MSDSEGEIPETMEAPERSRPLRSGRSIWGLLLAVLVLGLAGVWFQREQIAHKIIAGQIEKLDIPASYKLESIGVRRQVLKDIVIGDPAHPDLTIERAEVEIIPTLGLPTVGRVMLLRPRLFGTYRQAKASFGALDKLLFAEAGQPAGLPDLELDLIDGRARIDSDYGAIGIKAEGKGNLRSGFSGVLAAVSPELAGSGCKVLRPTFYGSIKVEDAKPALSGPLRMGALDCRRQGVTIKDIGIELAVSTNEAFDTVAGKLGLGGGRATLSGVSAARLSGKGDFTLGGNDLTARYRIEGKGVSAGYADASTLAFEGMVRGRDNFARIEGEGEIEGRDVRPGMALDSALGDARSAGKGTLLAPLAEQMRAALAREGRSSRLAASYTLRFNGDGLALTVPRGVLRGASGTDLLALSRFQLSGGGTQGLRLSGNVATSGAGLPHLEGRIERAANGMTSARFVMAEYRAGDARLALPRLVLAMTRGGEIGFSGAASLSGPLPGGKVDSLAVPLEGNWSTRRGLAMWRGCTPLRFEHLVVANLLLDRREVTLCPGPQGAIVRSDAHGLSIAAGTAGLSLGGMLGSTPVKLSSGPLGFAWPGALAARQITATLGGADTPNTLEISEMKARLGSVIEGSFAGTEVKLNAVPLDIFDANGQWRFANGDLSIDGATLRLEDRQLDDRFRPLIARDAMLKLHGDAITAEAMLREPKSDREIVRATIAHALNGATGHADLTVPGVVFDKRLQPDTLSNLALGVIANAAGVVAGNGRIDWNPRKVTSSGSFSTSGLDFAAAFGPVKGTAGTVMFTDLLGLVTAPDQRLKLASINPGIEVTDGVASFELQGDNVLMVNGAHWPFIDGTLELLPTRMVLGAAEVRRYTLKVEGVNAAKFLQQLELENLSATGTFDGTLPLVFDENGGRIEGGMLTARAPGGNLSYVGELTYEDMGAMANFAFQALRSLDYRQMQIGMEGSLEGEIVTRVRLDGVKQGEGTKRNFITRRLASLPIRFNINIRAPFQKLVGSFKSFYDPEYIRDPRELGLVKTPKPEKSSNIQPSESRDTP